MGALALGLGRGEEGRGNQHEDAQLDHPVVGDLEQVAGDHFVHQHQGAGDDQQG